MCDKDGQSDLFSRSRPSGHFTPDGMEIRIIGNLLAFDTEMNSNSVPEEHREHPLIDGQYFFTLPPIVLDAIVAEMAEEEFDAERLQFERTLSNICGDHASSIGFWNGVPISYQGLRPQAAADWPDDMIEAVGMDPLAVRHGLRTHEERDVVPLSRFRRGYTGWLMTNQCFLDEHDSLLANHASVVQRWGTYLSVDQFPESLRSMLVRGTDPTNDTSWLDFRVSLEEFLLRWRLSSLAAPYFPVPLQALMAGSVPMSMVRRLMSAGGVFYLPDTMPIPSRDQLRGILDDALHHSEPPEHLEEWLHIVRAGNPARNQMDRFARMFEVQHYWRIMMSRHSGVMEGRIGRMERAMSQVFDSSEETIHADLIEIRRRLGSDWLDRPWPMRVASE